MTTLYLRGSEESSKYWKKKLEEKYDHLQI